MMLRKILLITTLAVLASCKSIGPNQIRQDRFRYNESLLTTKKEELLGNIVRSRYLEPLTFMKISSITAAYTLNPSVSSGNSAVITPHAPSVYTWGLTPSLSYTDEPTISYVPITTSTFITEIYTPVELGSISTLLRGGVYNSKMILKLVIQYIYKPNLDNAEEISNEEIQLPPRYKRYYELLDLYDQLYRIRAVKLIPGTLDGSPTLVLHFSKKYIHHPLAIKMKKILKTPLHENNIFFASKSYPEENVLQVESRSIRGIINYLSRGVRVPIADLRANLVSTYQASPGCPYDFSPLIDDLFTVYSSDTEPADAFAKVYIQNHWFYIKKSDTKSKVTFNFLSTMIALTAKQFGSKEEEGPVLTLPVRT